MSLNAASYSQSGSATRLGTIGLNESWRARGDSPISARKTAVVNTCSYEVLAAYSAAGGTQLGAALRRPEPERTLANKRRAVSYSTYRALSDVFLTDTESLYKPVMRQLGYDPDDKSTDIETPTGIANVACGAVLEFRHHDNSNQLGDLAQGAYSDWTHYTPVNPPGSVPLHFPFTKPLNPDHWQPLTYIDSNGSLVLQMFTTAHWGQVTPFALTKGDQFRDSLSPLPARFGTPEYEAQARELLDLSAHLTDRQKMIAEYWTDPSGSSQVLDHWMQFAEFVSQRDHHSLDDDVKMYFALSNALFDTSIAAWDAKRAYDSVRPITAIAFLFHGQPVPARVPRLVSPNVGAQHCCAPVGTTASQADHTNAQTNVGSRVGVGFSPSPFTGTPPDGHASTEIDGGQWLPYQPATYPTPPCPEYVSEEAALSAAAARILELWTGSDRFAYSVTLAKRSSRIEPGLTPREPVTLKWDTFSEAADEAGEAGLYAGIHFRRSVQAGKTLGRAVADQAWAKAQSYFTGTAEPAKF